MAAKAKTYTWAGSKAKHTISEAAHKVAVRKKIAGRPVVPGGALTQGQLDASVKSAVADRYGLQEQRQQQTLGEAQAAKKDVVGPGGFYDQYLAAVAQHAKNVGDIAAASNAAVGSIGPAMTGLAGQDVAALQARTNADATARGMAPAGDVTNLASNALSVRQALAGSFMARQAAQNASTQGLADAQANVIAPAQKLTGANVAQGRIREAQKALTTTAAEKGAYAAGQRADKIADEQKSVLAMNIAAGKTAAEAAADAAKLKETTRSHKANEANAAARIAATQAKADADAKAKGSKPNEYGVPADQWASWSTAHRKRWIADFKNDTGSGKGGKGPGWLTKNESAAGLSNAVDIKRYADKAMKGEAFVQGHGALPPATSRPALEKKLSKWFEGKVKHPALFRAAVDAAWDGHISAYTVKQLIAAGYKPSQVASTLGVQTSGEFKRTRGKRLTQNNAAAYGKQGNLGQTGHQ